MAELRVRNTDLQTGRLLIAVRKYRIASGRPAGVVENIDLVGRAISCECDGAVVGTGYLERVCDTGRACDGAGLTYADMVRRKG